jgi:hypothetical protein
MLVVTCCDSLLFTLLLSLFCTTVTWVWVKTKRYCPGTTPKSCWMDVHPPKYDKFVGNPSSKSPNPIKVYKSALPYYLSGGNTHAPDTSKHQAPTLTQCHQSTTAPCTLCTGHLHPDSMIQSESRHERRLSLNRPEKHQRQASNHLTLWLFNIAMV